MATAASFTGNSMLLDAIYDLKVLTAGGADPETVSVSLSSTAPPSLPSTYNAPSALSAAPSALSAAPSALSALGVRIGFRIEPKASALVSVSASATGSPSAPASVPEDPAAELPAVSREAQLERVLEGAHAIRLSRALGVWSSATMAVASAETVFVHKTELRKARRRVSAPPFPLPPFRPAAPPPDRPTRCFNPS